MNKTPNSAELHLCIDRILPRQPVPGSVDDGRLAADSQKLWLPHQRVLHVRFLDGTPALHAKVVRFAQEWMRYAGVQWIFDNAADAPIRIAFQPGSSWSLIGADALDPRISKDEPTMNLGGLTPATPNDEVSRVVLHEFGHALGLIHEHQHPTGDIPWNRQAVYDFYAGPPNNWTAEEIEQNIFRRYSQTLSNYSAFDRHSIMLYPIPPQFTDGVYTVGWNKTLSPTDKRYIGVIYPLPPVSPPPGPSA
jgi:hypothetical protein